MSAETSLFQQQVAADLSAEIQLICHELKHRSHIERLQWVHDVYGQVVVTSSFGTSAAVLLELYHQAGIHQPVHFIDTGFHFQETHQYKELLRQHYQLELIDIKADAFLHHLTASHQLWKRDPNACCAVNKTTPMENALKGQRVWISGLMSWQSPTRKNMSLAEVKNGVIKIHPLADFQEQAVTSLFQAHQIPEHPLQEKGYGSIGCTHCTAPGRNREGRWIGHTKTECGLHIDQPNR
jgi:phosphoadenosine phosphosulfate reductase